MNKKMGLMMAMGLLISAPLLSKRLLDFHSSDLIVDYGQ